MVSSGTSWPRLMKRSASRPRGVPAATAARSRAPDARIGTPSRAAIAGACVPFPAPGGPSRTMTLTIGDGAGPPASADESLVVPHHQLRFDLLHRLDDDRDDDQQARATEAEGGEIRHRERDDRR